MVQCCIFGLVTRSSWRERTRSPHRRAGLTKLHNRLSPLCMRQPSLSPFTYVGFRVFAVTPQSGLANGPMSGPHSCTDALTDKPARELASGITGTERNGDLASSPTYGALWKLKLDLIGAVVLINMAEVGGITRLACPMEKE